MRKQTINVPGIPKSPGYSQAVRIGNTVYVAGTIAFDPKTLKVEETTIEGQTDRAIQNCATILRAAGSSLDDVVQVIVLLKNPADVVGMSAVYTKHFPKDEPARAITKLGVDRPDVLVSFMMTAVIPDGSS